MGIIIGFVHYFLPTQAINNLIFTLDDGAEENKEKYEDALNKHIKDDVIIFFNL